MSSSKCPECSSPAYVSPGKVMCTYTRCRYHQSLARHGPEKAEKLEALWKRWDNCKADEVRPILDEMSDVIEGSPV